MSCKVRTWPLPGNRLVAVGYTTDERIAVWFERPQSPEEGNGVPAVQVKDGMVSTAISLSIEAAEAAANLILVALEEGYAAYALAVPPEQVEQPEKEGE